MRALLTNFAVLACLCLTGSSALAWGKKTQTYTVAPATQVVPVSSGYVLTPSRHRFFQHHHQVGVPLMMVAPAPLTTGSVYSGYTQPARLTGCTGSLSSPLTGCTGSYSAPLTGCTGSAPMTGSLSGCTGGGAQTGSLTSPQAEQELDRALARWRTGTGGRVDVDVQVRVRVNGIEVTPGGGRPPTTPDTTVSSGNLDRDLQVAFTQDARQDRISSLEDAKALAGVYSDLASDVNAGQVKSRSAAERKLRTDARPFLGNLPQTRKVIRDHLTTALSGVPEGDLDQTQKNKVVEVLKQVAASLNKVQ